MKFTLSWLKDHLETDASLDQITEKLTALGLEVEGVQDRSKELAPFRVAHVVSAEKHPDADKLRVLMVDTGAGTLQVVCGAPNARAGMKGVFAPEGTYVPGSDITLKKGVIRGVESNGMMCSKRELKLSDEHEGIIELPDDAPVGAGFADYAGLNDPVIDINLTPDRADCAGVRGIARDLAAAGMGRLKPLTEGRLNATPVPGSFKSPIGVEIESLDACPYYVGRYFRGVKNGPSPQWLQDKLTAIGLRPISILVDITNYITFDVSRPLHAFDADKVKGGIVVRLAREGETLPALNGKEYQLDPAMTVIADHERAEALGGIIGGEASGCTEETTNVFLEAAIFDTVRTAQTGRRLGIESDARYRLERGVDPAAVVEGIERATRLILDLCGGEASEIVTAGAEPKWKRTLTLRPGRVAALGGVELPRDRQERILTDLGFTLEGEDAEGRLVVGVPSWRADVHGEADLVEEVLRVHGFDAIPATPLPRETVLTRPALTLKQRRVALAKRTLAARGLSEAVTWSFLSGAVAELFGGGEPGLRLVNPISSDLDVMRPSILPNLIQAAGRNADRGYADVRLFEVGAAFRNPAPDGQDSVAAGIRAGAAVPRHWAEKARGVDVFDAKADALAVLEAVGAPAANLQVTTDAPGWYHPGRSGVLRLGPTVMARFGEIHPSVLETLGVKGPVVGFEVMLDAVPLPKKKGGTAKPMVQLSAFQPVERDFAFVVDRKVEADKILRAVKGADKALVKDVAVFDVYEGPGVGEGRKSVAVSVTYQPTTATLTDEAIEAVGQKIVASVVKATGGNLRA
ncbi:phenylalanyl-tRNA synthetase beta chain [Azospirillum lipoferum]|uniref:Phenylalanine--tRNA ligase beta subunit n=1 Tax=Azospirillum lipoferum TaxID=193 RepID=A0A5A9GD15_AZOLI|nr:MULTISPECIES: phenylalanine--tRNA ligase subunit beta [Azospirillum]KAA0592281.1 phenylalanine--tRNA ligase subunit beta [Azospirillum lipoferum]MCP1612228.1 phenylalanyl-tRNA synthetase beta chain [Azospirillum lipoferum]MDW5536550.1 phenylalanine--tRNA ligase subunit beta [Azospirillum sp. NL1]